MFKKLIGNKFYTVLLCRRRVSMINPTLPRYLAGQQYFKYPIVRRRNGFARYWNTTGRSRRFQHLNLAAVKTSEERRQQYYDIVIADGYRTKTSGFFFFSYWTLSALVKNSCLKIKTEKNYTSNINDLLHMPPVHDVPSPTSPYCTSPFRSPSVTLRRPYWSQMGLE